MKKLLLATFAATAIAQTASAHFLLPYTDQTQIERPGDVPMQLIFWHPFENGFVMDLAEPEEFYVIHSGEKTDLMDTLEQTSFEGSQNAGQSYQASVPVKRSGDYVVVTVPQPYYEDTEDKYIQQFTKVMLNRNGLPTDWSEVLDLPAEIQPLNKPYNMIVGSTFSGRVLADGEPVAGVEIEVEYVAAVPDMAQSSTTTPSVTTMPGGAVVAISDANGYFTFGVPRAGWWGFAALGAGKTTEFDGKELSQDAVIWVHAYEME